MAETKGKKDNNLSEALAGIAVRLQSLAETGQHYSTNDYDLDRYCEIEKAAAGMLSILGAGDVKQVLSDIREDNGYKTPKVDVRAVVLNDDGEILMVREKIDGCWSLPGGWADIGYSPSEVAVKETFEEAGMEVRPGELLAVLDKRNHNHPPDIYYIYKIFIRCYPLNKRLKNGYETTEVGFFAPDRLPELSAPRNTREQIMMMFSLCKGEINMPLID
ncbi:MAG: NUDIX hydrolase N-terminal domain-containing protein [Bacteroidota bacterium]